MRALVRAGDEGLAVGEIQRKLDIPASTLTHHLNHLKNAGLLRQQRRKASLVCRMEYGKLNDVVAYLTEECCMDSGGHQGAHLAG